METKKHRRPGRPGHSRESVILTAVQAFNDNGYEATSMSQLAARLNLSKSAIYHHIDSKEQILKEATDEALNALQEVVDSCDALDANASQRLEHLIRQATLTLCNKSIYVTLLVRLRGNTPTEVESMQRRRAFTDYLYNLVKEAQAEGSVRPDLDPGVAARLTFGMINSITDWYNPEGALSPEAIANTVTDTVLRGITT